MIERCLRSIMNQSYPHIEHIVIDGGSSDNTIEVLDFYREKYCLRWISEPDQGMYDAINKGLSLARGEIISYLNTDDFYFPYTVQTVVEAFLSTDADIIYGDWINYYTEFGFVEFLPTPPLDKYDMMVFGVLPQPSVFIRRRVFDAVGGFDLKYKLIADNEFFTRAAFNGFRISKINEVLSCQVIHGGNTLAGNPRSQTAADAELKCYRAIYRDLTIGSEGLRGYLCLARAAITERIYPLLWRIWLYKYLVRVTLRYSGHWDRFYHFYSRAPISWWKLVGYCLSRRSKTLFRYCVDPSFLERI